MARTPVHPILRWHDPTPLGHPAPQRCRRPRRPAPSCRCPARRRRARARRGRRTPGRSPPRARRPPGPVRTASPDSPHHCRPRHEPCAGAPAAPPVLSRSRQPMSRHLLRTRRHHADQHLQDGTRRSQRDRSRTLIALLPRRPRTPRSRPPRLRRRAVGVPLGRQQPPRSCPRRGVTRPPPPRLQLDGSLPELADTNASLHAAGVDVHATLDFRVSQALFISDPDDNLIELYVDTPGEPWRTQPTLVANAEPLDLARAG